MQNVEKLCLQWNDFKENVSSAFGQLRGDKELSDVTLACEDGQQIEAHKVILASSSPFFMELLRKNKHGHPLIYMRGLKFEDLAAVVDFLYLGEANVIQERLDDFLALAEELKLKGLTGSAKPNDEECVAKTPPEKKIAPKKEHRAESTQSFPNPLNINSNPNADTESFSMTPVALGLVSTDGQQLDQQITSMMNITENLMTTGNQSVRVWTCNVCGKEGHRANIKTHIEANHIVSNVSHSCDICGKISRSRDGLRQHKAKEH